MAGECACADGEHLGGTQPGATGHFWEPLLVGRRAGEKAGVVGKSLTWPEKEQGAGKIV